MVSVVIYGIIAIALAAAAGYALLVFSSTTQQTTQVQENSVRMEQAVNALRASLLALDGTGTLFAPMGYNPGTTGSYTQLPTSLGAVSSSPWGTPFEYCPVSLVSTTGLTTTAQTVTGTTSSYTANVYQASATGNNYYVITTNAPTQLTNLATAASYGYVAFIVSSLSAGSNPPDCSAIMISSTGVAVPGGSVRGVTAGFPFTQRVIASTDRMEIYVGTAATGDTTGRDINNLTTLANAVAMWQALQPRLTDIYLTGGGTYTLSQDINAQTSRNFAMFESPALIIAGANGPNSPASATLDITVPLYPTTPVTFADLTIIDTESSALMIYSSYGAPLNFYGVNFSGPSSFYEMYTQGTVQLVATSLTNVSFVNDGGSVIVNPCCGTTGQSFTNTAVSIYNGRFWLQANGTFKSQNLSAAASNFTFVGSTAEIDNNPYTLTVNNTATAGAAFVTEFNSSLWFQSGGGAVNVDQNGTGGWAFLTQHNSNLTFNTVPLTVTSESTAGGGFLTLYNSNVSFGSSTLTVTVKGGTGFSTDNSNLTFASSTTTITNSDANAPVLVTDNSTMTLTSSTLNISNSGSANIGVYARAGQIVSDASTVSVNNAAGSSHAIFLEDGSTYDGYGNSVITAAGNTYSPLTVEEGSAANLLGVQITHNGSGPCLYVMNDAAMNWLPITKSIAANTTNQLYLPYYTTSNASSQDINNANAFFETNGSFTGSSPSVLVTPTPNPTQVDPTSLINVLDDFASKSFANKRLTINNFTCN
jgi:hypothetical protein